MSDFVFDGNWSSNLLSRFLPREICQRILDFPASVCNAVNDHLHWDLNSSGKFSMSSAINCLTNCDVVSQEDHELWKIIWN